MRLAAFFIAAVSSLSLAGCAAMVGGITPAPTTYDLVPPRISTVRAPRPAEFQLVVNEPTAVRSLGSDRLLVKPGADQVSYFKGAAWSDRLPKLVQDRMVQAFQNAGLVKAVGSRTDRLNADIELASQLNAFQIEISQSGAVAHVSLFVKVIDGNRGVMIDSRAFDAKVSTSATEASEMVAALNQGFDTVLRKIVPWVAARRS